MAGRKKSRMGRPPIPTEEQLSQRVVAHLRPADFDALRAWAEREGRQPGELAREILERALRRRK